MDKEQLARNLIHWHPMMFEGLTFEEALGAALKIVEKENDTN